MTDHPDYEPAIDPIHWSSAVDTSDMKRVGPSDTQAPDATVEARQPLIQTDDETI